MRVGGPADLFATVYNLFELRGLVRFARSRELPIFLLGRGSDLVISDAGIGGLVIQVRAQGVRIEGSEMIAEAGLPMAKAATLGREAGLSGLEFGLAIPGTIGGAIWANAGRPRGRCGRLPGRGIGHRGRRQRGRRGGRRARAGLSRVRPQGRSTRRAAHRDLGPLPSGSRPSRR